MSDKDYILSVDQGTTSSRAIAFSLNGQVLGLAQTPFRQIYPQDGWVEHDAEEIWGTTLSCLRAVIAEQAEKGRTPLCLGITNQRETTIVWDRETGKPIHNAIVWQDRRTAGLCADLKAEGHEAAVSERTGLLLDPYFSATKLAWILDHAAGARDAAKAGRLAFGTVETFLAHRLSGGVHVTDASNAARTLLYDIVEGKWDDGLLDLFRVPRAILPEVVDSAGTIGRTDKALLGIDIPISGLIGDQQGAAIGQAAISPGMAKATYGTGCFMLMNTGKVPVRSENRLLTTIAARIGGELSYAVEGSIFCAGAAVRWLRDGLKIVDDVGRTAELAAGLPDNGGVYLVPGYTGLGAPHWEPAARGTITGLTLDSGPAQVARATLESVAYQTHDLLEAMEKDGVPKLAMLRVDGGMAANDWFLDFLAGTLDVTVARPKVTETTAFGAAFLAGLGAGVYERLDDITTLWAEDRVFKPQHEAAKRSANLTGWRRATAQCLKGV